MEDIELELEALQSIFEEELVIDRPSSKNVVVRKRVRPNEDGGISSASIWVEFNVHEKYPEEPPKVVLSCSRGISEMDHSKLEEEVAQRLDDNQGMPVLYDILQHVSDFLATHQHSSSQSCPICLFPFSADAVGRTPCDHFAHSTCLKDYETHTRRFLGETLQKTPNHLKDTVDVPTITGTCLQALYCPVCREVVDEEVEPIYPEAPKPTHSGRRRSKIQNVSSSTTQSPSSRARTHAFDYDWSSWRKQQSEMKVIFEKQKANGGIIDLEEEKKKNLITEDTVIVLPSTTTDSDIGSNVTNVGRNAKNQSNTGHRRGGETRTEPRNAEGRRETRYFGNQRGGGQGGARGHRRDEGGRRGQRKEYRGKGDQNGGKGVETGSVIRNETKTPESIIQSSDNHGAAIPECIRDLN